ncbi:MAG: MotA/TolQ/ExbB proton channel family protein, partial [Planctomycetes bacterium]|nr:MotA/TolQ/ExbB proton channel family protein [Planctomycetota bacterium]
MSVVKQTQRNNKGAIAGNRCIGRGRCVAGGWGISVSRCIGVAIFALTVLAGPARAEGFLSIFAAPQGATTFYSQFVVAGGPIVWFILLPMSVITVYLAADLCLTIRRKKLLPARQVSSIASVAGGTEPWHLTTGISSSPDLVSRAVSRALNQSKAIGSDRHIRQLAVEALHDGSLKLFRRVEWCNIIGNIAPMVGLFGTVFGMIKAFTVLSEAGGQPRPDQLAAAISIALITTFWGLLVAIPALSVCGIFRNRLEAIVSEAAVEVEVFLDRMDTADIESKSPAPAKALRNPIGQPVAVMQRIPIKPAAVTPAGAMKQPAATVTPVEPVKQPGPATQPIAVGGKAAALRSPGSLPQPVPVSPPVTAQKTGPATQPQPQPIPVKLSQPI